MRYGLFYLQSKQPYNFWFLILSHFCLCAEAKYGVNSRSSSRPVRVSGPQEAQPRATGTLNSGPQVQHRPGAAHPSPRPHRGSAARRPLLRPHRRRAAVRRKQLATASGGSRGEGGGAVHLSFQHLLMADSPAESQADTPL